MNKVNSVIIEGNLVRVPELRTTPGGTPVCVFTIAVNRKFKKGVQFQEEVSFFDIETWSDEAQRCSKVLEKGYRVTIIGRLKQDRWQDSDGKNHYRVKVVADRVEYKKRVDNQDFPGSLAAVAENGKSKEGVYAGKKTMEDF